MIILLSNKLSCVKNRCKSYTRSFSIISRYFTILLLFICVIYHFFFYKMYWVIQFSSRLKGWSFREVKTFTLFMNRNNTFTKTDLVKVILSWVSIYLFFSIGLQCFLLSFTDSSQLVFHFVVKGVSLVEQLENKIVDFG